MPEGSSIRRYYLKKDKAGYRQREHDYTLLGSGLPTDEDAGGWNGRDICLR